MKRSPWLYVCAVITLMIGAFLLRGGGTIDITARFPQLSLNGQTNIVSDNGSIWTFNGVPFCTNCGGGLTMNPTDNYLPYRQNATTFGDSPWYRASTNQLGFRTTNRFLYALPDGITDGFVAIGYDTITNVDESLAVNKARSVFLGNRAAADALYAGSSIAIGWEAGAYATNFSGSVAIGQGGNPEDGYELVAVGYGVGPGFGVSRQETLIGAGAKTGEAGTSNVVVGAYGLYNGSGGSMGDPVTVLATSVGAGAGYVPPGITGSKVRSYGTFVGAEAGKTPIVDVNITNAIAIGFNVPITNSNEIVIGNVNNTRTILPGYVINNVSWDDSQVPEAMVRSGATAPTLANFNGGPVQTLQFQNNRDDTIMATVQMTHRWKQGTDIHPHVHWCETAATGAGTNIVWQLTYAWTNLNCAYPAYTTVTITNSVTGTNWFSQLSDFPDIPGTGHLVSSIFVFELKRLANSATADDYNQNVAFLGFDIHHQVDSPGSDSELTKSF